MKKHNLSIASYLTIGMYWIIGAFLTIAPIIQIVRGAIVDGFEWWQIPMAVLPIIGVLLAVAATKDAIEND